ncbi:MAG: FtsX-like permease family protein [Pseudomonadota bacterium]
MSSRRSPGCLTRERSHWWSRLKGFEWFVAWRYLRARGGRSGLITLGIGLVLAICAASMFYLGIRTPDLDPLAALAGAVSWKRVYMLLGVCVLAVAVLLLVFGCLRAVQSVFTTISAFGVFLGTAALVIVLSVMNGFEEDLRRKILGSNAHLLVTKEEGPFTEWQDIEHELDRVPGVVAHSAYVSSEVVVAANSNYSSAIIKGIDPGTAGRVTDLEKNLEEGSRLVDLWPISPGAATREKQSPSGEGLPIGGGGHHGIGTGDDSGGEGDDAGRGSDGGAAEDDREDDDGDEPIDFSGETLEGRALSQNRTNDALDGVLVGRELARSLHLYIGGEVQIISPLGQDTPMGQVPRTRRFRVAGVFFTGMYEYDTRYVYVAVPALQRFLALENEVTGIEIKAFDSERTTQLVDAIGERLARYGSYRVQDWKELNRSLFSALKLEKIAMFLVLTIIILVASFSIVSNLIMVVVEKSREIAIMKSMGATNGGVMRVFMFEGLYVGALGTSFGLVVGIGTCWALGRFGLPLDPRVYYIDRLPIASDPMAIAAIALAGLALSFVATVYPSYMAARLKPVEGLRDVGQIE